MSTNDPQLERQQPGNEEETPKRIIGLAFVRLLFYTRFSLFTGLILLFLGVLPLIFSTPTITAVYIQSTPLRMGTLTLVSFLASALVIMTFRTTLYNATERFSDPEMEGFAEATRGWIWNARRFSWLVIGAPLPLTSLYYTWQETVSLGASSPLMFVIGMLIGFVSALLLLILLAYIHRRFVTPNIHDPRFFPFDMSRKRRQLEAQVWKRSKIDVDAEKQRLSGFALVSGRRIAKFFTRIGLNQGYVTESKVWIRGNDSSNEEPFPTVGHGPLILFTLILLILHLVVLGFGPWTFRHWGWVPSDNGPFGALFFLVGLLMIFICVLPGLAFLLDRHRIPVSWVFAAVFVGFTIGGWVFPGLIVDHAYPVAPQPIYVEKSEDKSKFEADVEVKVSDKFLSSPISLDEVIQGWAKRQRELAKPGGEPNRTFVVVTAAGGGIQASGWTTTVLSGIAENEEIRPLIGAIGMVSSVSGGSVGMLHFLTRYPELTSAIREDDEGMRKLLLGDAIDQSIRSSLEAVGWGLLFPDTWRNVGFVRDPQYDRGWVQEQVWADRMNLLRFSDPDQDRYVEDWQREDWRLGHLAYRVREGELPAVIFNGFSTTTGQRIWMAPFQLRDANSNRFPLDYAEFSGAMGMQLKLSTAARISATFPYVSPTTIAKSGNHPQIESMAHYSAHLLSNSHLADGGYTDNEGLLTALELVLKLDQYFDDHPETCPFDKVLLLRIAPFPAPEQIQDALFDPDSQHAIEKDPPYLQGLAGPALGLYRGRTVTQMERGDLEVDIFENLFTLRDELQTQLNQQLSQSSQIPSGLTDDGFPGLRMSVKQNPSTRKYEIQSQIVQEDDADDNGVKEVRYLQFEHKLVDFRLEKNGENVHPPLSWKLNHEQKKDLTSAWKRWQMDESLANLFEEKAPSSAESKGPVFSTADPSQFNPVEPNLPTYSGEAAPNVMDLGKKFRGRGRSQ